MRHLRLCLLAGSLCLLPQAFAEPCTTQSQMTAAERDTLVRVGTALASATAANNADAVRAQTNGCRWA